MNIENKVSQLGINLNRFETAALEAVRLGEADQKWLKNYVTANATIDALRDKILVMKKKWKAEQQQASYDILLKKKLEKAGEKMAELAGVMGLVGQMAKHYETSLDKILEALGMDSLGMAAKIEAVQQKFKLSLKKILCDGLFVVVSSDKLYSQILGTWDNKTSIKLAFPKIITTSVESCKQYLLTKKQMKHFNQSSGREKAFLESLDPKKIPRRLEKQEDNRSLFMNKERSRKYEYVLTHWVRQKFKKQDMKSENEQDDLPKVRNKANSRKYYIVFNCEVLIKFADGMERKIQVFEPTLACCIISHGNQQPTADAAILWEDAFQPEDFQRKEVEVKEKKKIITKVVKFVRWEHLFQVLSKKFTMLTAAAPHGRQLGEYEKKYFHQLLEVPEDGLVSFEMLAYNNAKKPVPFYTWFFKITQAINSDALRRFWTDQRACIIHGFVARSDVERFLSGCQPGSFLVRFTEKKQTNCCLSFHFVNSAGSVDNVKPSFIEEQLSAESLEQIILKHDTLQFLMPCVQQASVMGAAWIQANIVPKRVLEQPAPEVTLTIRKGRKKRQNMEGAEPGYETADLGSPFAKRNDSMSCSVCSSCPVSPVCNQDFSASPEREDDFIFAAQLLDLNQQILSREEGRALIVENQTLKEQVEILQEKVRHLELGASVWPQTEPQPIDMFGMPQF